MSWGFVIVGPAIVAYVILFLILLYRLAGIRPGERERRRMTVFIASLAVFVIALAALFALRAPGAYFYWVPVTAAAYLGLRRLQDSGHWLVTPTTEERAMATARRQAVVAALQRPAFWLLTIGLTVGFVVVTISVAIILA